MSTLPSTIDELKPSPRNPRKINRKAAAGLKASLKEFGDLSVLTFNVRTQAMVAGHQRRDALKGLKGAAITWGATHETTHGPETFGTLRLPGGEEFRVRAVDWDPVKEAAANIAANAPTIAGEFTDGLQAMLAEVQEGMPFVFDDLGLAALLEDVAGDDAGDNAEGEPESEPDAEPEAITVDGDIWVLGQHRILCGDALAPSTLALLGLDVADPKTLAVMSDPPYGMNEATNRKERGRGPIAGARDFPPVAGDDSTATAVDAFKLAETRFPESLRVFWGANWYLQDEAGGGIIPNGGAWVVWDKSTMVDGRQHVVDNADGELAWSSRGGPMRIFRHLWKGILKGSERGENRIHPTQKPVELYRWLLKDYPREQPALVWDQFMGSGSCLMACESLGIPCVTAELAPAYVDRVIERWQAATGKVAVHAITGKPFGSRV